MYNKLLSDIALGKKKAELVLKNCQIVDVFGHGIEYNDIAIHDGKIIGIGRYDGEKEIDLNNK